MKIKIDTSPFLVNPNSEIDLSQWSTEVSPFYESKEDYLTLLEESRQEIGALQEVLYAHDRYAVLLIFQGMDSAGKGGAIKHVMSGINPQGCQVFSFLAPGPEALEHDFLWRTSKSLPERGRIGIFDRSYYEEVVVVRIQPHLLEQQRIPAEFVDPEHIWQERFSDIVNLENYLHRNGTRIIKFFLHLSKKEQRKRLIARIDDPTKNWKISNADIEARRKWHDYQHAYEECIGATSSATAPWFIIPADDKRNTRLIVSSILLETLQSLKMNYPQSSDIHRTELARMQTYLESDE
ncbi:MAG: polyphosphate kinase 2 family protein [Nitrosomonas sp.]|nr:polyphosphate kinase 2 family protein [Nitrosomonas sp.]